MTRSKVAITFEPLTQWPMTRPQTSELEREDAKFKGTGSYEPIETGGDRWVSAKRTPLSRTLDDLDRELWQIGATNVVVQVDVTNKQNLRDDVRRDGVIRTDARVASPAIVVSFVGRGKVPLVFACDHFQRWHDNLRAIALGLEGLRRLERYHIAQTGDQYRGWQALPASTTTAFTIDQAATYLARMSGNDTAAPAIAKEIEIARKAYRLAAANTHPDRGGSTGNFQLTQEAKRVLSAHFGATL